VNGADDQATHSPELTGFTANMTRRAQWARDRNAGRPSPAWPAGEQLAVALVLLDKTTLQAGGHTRQEAAQRLAADLAFYGYPAGPDTWLQAIRVALGTAPHPELPYTRCPSCGLVAQPGSMSYRLADDGGIDWSGAADASCGICGRTHAVTRDQVMPLDAVYTCPRSGCGAVTPRPGSAARVQCHWCGVHGIGPGTVSDQDRAYLDEVERLHGIELRARVLSARRASEGR
jgi:hypothetical protein